MSLLAATVGPLAVTVGPLAATAGPLAATGPVIPDYRAASSSCVVHNRLFCTEWITHNWGPILWPALRQHILLTAAAVAIGFLIAAALAITAHRYDWIERPTIVVTTILYTIPSLALFELLVAPVGANVVAAEIALVTYTLLILFRNLLTGLREVPAEVREAAQGMGMSRRQTLLRVELPLALPAIVAGLRIATVTIIALATIVYVVCNQGLGVPIHTALGEGPFKTELIAAGGLAILLALLADALLVGLQRLLTPWLRVRGA
jgi:osmoprotectant transport system permease protein